MRRIRVAFLLIVLISLTSTVLSLDIHAQDIQNGFSISPPSFDLNANPNDSIKNTIKIENPSGQSLKIGVRTENFVTYGDTGQINLTEEDSTYSINKWVTLSENEFIIEPGQEKLFDFTLNIPSNTEPGSHYGAIVFATIPSSEPGASSIVQEIGSIILIRIPGDVTEEANLISFDSERDFFTDPKVKLNALIENIGSVHFKPYGFIVIEDIFGNKIQTIDVQPKNILPGSKRIFEEEFDFDKIGIFRAELQLFYKNGGKNIIAQTNFVSLYTQRLIPVLAVLLGIIAFYLIFRKRINKAVRVIIKG